MVVRGTFRLVGWCLALAVTLTVLHLLPVPDGPVDLASRDPADLLPVLLRGARWVALTCAWYLTGATVLSALTAVVAWRPLRRLDAALSVPMVRHVVRTGLGATLAVGLGIGPSAAAFAAPGPPGASGQPAPLSEDDVPAGDQGVDTGHRDPGGGELVLPDPRHVVAPDDPAAPPIVQEEDDPAGDTVRPAEGDASAAGDHVRPPEVAEPGTRPAAGDPPRGPAPSPRPTGPDARSVAGRAVDSLPSRAVAPTSPAGERTAPVPPSEPPASGPRTIGSDDADSTEGEGPDASSTSETGTHEVVTGESFWSIAADLTAAELDRAPEDAEVFERWIALIDHNRDLLLVPDDPDLLLPGQRLRLPGGER